MHVIHMQPSPDSIYLTLLNLQIITYDIQQMEKQLWDQNSSFR